jgi:hypothetical protein
LRLQFRQRKQLAQKAWSPVRMARSSILLPQWLQLYVQLLHISEPSPRSRRFASESSRVPHVLQRKQSMCHRLPAGGVSVGVCRASVSLGNAYRAQRPCLPRGSRRPLALSPAPSIGSVLPLHSPCTDTRHRPGPAATQGTLPATPWLSEDLRRMRGGGRVVGASGEAEWPSDYASALRRNRRGAASSAGKGQKSRKSQLQLCNMRAAQKPRNTSSSGDDEGLGSSDMSSVSAMRKLRLDVPSRRTKWLAGGARAGSSLHSMALIGKRQARVSGEH